MHLIEIRPSDISFYEEGVTHSTISSYFASYGSLTIATVSPEFIPAELMAIGSFYNTVIAAMDALLAGVYIPPETWITSMNNPLIECGIIADRAHHELANGELWTSVLEEVRRENNGTT